MDSESLQRLFESSAWRENVPPVVAAKLRSLERYAIGCADLESLQKVRAQYDALKHFETPERLLKWLKAETGG